MSTPNNYSYLAKNIKPAYPPLIRGEGARVFDVNGKTYLDFCSQTLNLNLGHCHPRIVDAVKKQLDRIYYTSSRFLDEPTLQLAKKLIEISPPQLTKVNLKMTGGSEANECAIKMVRKYHSNNTIVATYKSFFGESLETMRCSGNFFDKAFLGGKNGYVYVNPAYCFRCPFNKNRSDCGLECAKSFENIFKCRDDICSIILEPIIVNAGVIIPPRDYLKEVRRICDEHDITLIFDEAQTAFGWTGEMFAANYFNVVPDILTICKGLSAGFPLGAAIFKEKYDLLEYGEHEFTYGAHPVSCAAAIETIKILTESDFLNVVKSKGEYLNNRLMELETFDCIGDVRTCGFLAGLEFIKENKNPDSIKAKKIYEICLKNGIIFRLSSGFKGNVLIIKPPLIISKEEIDIAIDTLRESISVSHS